ncbi:hypothetical protein H257_12479 [Aphanomyces astaci]|uniref:Uncharacterized protein n=1 Tax=Aphanomyces astaci TaxID=112090 RepID=W4FXT5_APHAT|nr:hypothetical protein H257_12479 [Aphanomyces astaci]ETV72315.1 hypothetical protein H257_12479 [Aphanomyces astaci]|eukprot:XP_009837997.1 hypothetical protein H257_12479 [Aphanomyces astaci]
MSLGAHFQFPNTVDKENRWFPYHNVRSSMWLSMLALPQASALHTRHPVESESTMAPAPHPASNTAALVSSWSHYVLLAVGLLLVVGAHIVRKSNSSVQRRLLCRRRQRQFRSKMIPVAKVVGYSVLGSPNDELPAHEDYVLIEV